MAFEWGVYRVCTAAAATVLRGRKKRRSTVGFGGMAIGVGAIVVGLGGTDDGTDSRWIRRGSRRI